MSWVIRLSLTKTEPVLPLLYRPSMLLAKPLCRPLQCRRAKHEAQLKHEDLAAWAKRLEAKDARLEAMETEIQRSHAQATE